MASLTRPRLEDTIRMLIERINWPVRMVRLQVAREYAALLGSPNYRHLASQIFLNWIRDRKLESEVVSALAILACTPEQYLIPFQQLKANIQCPSILADVLVQNIYQRSLGGWLDAHSVEAPPSFAGDMYFDKYKHSHVAPILDHVFGGLEKQYRFPFLKQWKFEWRTLVESTNAPLSSFPYHFMNWANLDWANYRDSGVEGQFIQRQSDVYRSAYLRTLAFAVSHWKMPALFAADVALFSLPVNLELIKLRPGARPKWSADISERNCEPNAPMEPLIREILTKADSKSQMRPVCIKIPVSSNVSLFGDLWITAVLVSADYIPNSGNGPRFSQGVDWPLHDGISFRGSLPRTDIAKFASQGLRGSAIPCCLDLWPTHAGFWHGDYYQLGLSAPATYLFSGDLCIACTEHRVEIFNEQTLTATVSIWHDDWSPLYPKKGTTRCGLVTDMRRSDIARAEQELGLKLGWLARLRLWRREKDYSPFELTERQVFLRDF